MNSISSPASSATRSASLPDGLSQRLGQLREVEDADPSLVQLTGHRRGVADIGSVLSMSMRSKQEITPRIADA
jgi:hypothetical protein